MQPGESVQPAQPPAEQTPLAEVPPTVPTAPETPPTPPVPPEPLPQLEAAPMQEPTEPNDEASWQYTNDSEATAAPAQAPDIKPINWTASEFVEHQKQPTWFLGLGVAMLAISVIAYLITHDVITTGAIALAFILFGVTGARKPRTLQYLLDEAGVHIGDRLYGYDLFKSFSLIEEGAFSSIQLSPLKRLMPPLSLYYPPEQEEPIMNLLGSYLPHEIRKHDPLDRLMHRLRF